jgi:phage/plasmid primase-like uncharacterized protein
MNDATSPERVRSALSHLCPDDRMVWVRQAMAIKSEFGESGFDLWDEWGSQSEVHTASTAKSTWRSVKADGKITIATLFYDAKQAGWKDVSTYEKPSAEEIAKCRALRAQRDAEAEAQEEAQHEAVAEQARLIWDAAKPYDEHPYLTFKAVKSYGLRVGNFPVERVNPNTGEATVVTTQALLVPLVDRSRRIWSVQAISGREGGSKLLLKHGRKSGNFFVIGKAKVIDGRRVFVLVEGYATGASLHEATGHMVLVCIDAGNLRNVARQLRERDPEAIIVVAADNDLWGRRADGTPYNPGMAAAQKVAAEVQALVAAPPFCESDAFGTDAKGKPTGPTDWNDWHRINGLNSVTEYFDDALKGALQTPMQQVIESDALDRQQATMPTCDAERRHLQQVENQRLQEMEIGAVIPSDLSVDVMIERCVWIADGRHVAYVTDDRSLFLKFDDFRALTVSSKTEVEVQQREKLVNKWYPNANLWQSDKRRVDAMTATFHPGSPIITINPNGLRAVNTWRPIKRWPATVDITPFLEQVEYLFPNPTERNAFLDWLAHIEQKPGELPHYSWLHIAENTGTGRNWMASVLARVFRGYVAPNVDLPALLLSPYNGELGGRVLAIVDEVQEGASEGNYRNTERLKSMVNAEMRTVNNKYGLKYVEFNTLRWLVFSNHKNALPLNDEDRRFRVVMHKAPPRSPEIYERLYALLQDAEFINSVGVYLRGRDISRFKPGERPPLNADKLAAIAASKPMSTQAAEEIVACWPADVITYKHAIELLTGDPEKKDFTAGMRRAMEEAGAVTWGQGDVKRIKMNGAPHRVWVLRKREKWMAESTDAIRREVGRANVNDQVRPAAAVLADAVELMANLYEPPI